jgi:3-hydroxyisobutyrate dehydrogenase-like beta-hydroxyacid dehydrogenase
MSTVGFVGLGTMGSRVAARLHAAGHEVYVTNRTKAKAQPLLEQGMKWLGTGREVAAAAEVTFSMVTDDDALAAIAGGDDGILAGLAPGKVWVDMSTVSPGASRRVASQAGDRGAQMLDAPVSGSVPQVESGTLSIMVGGDAQAFATAEPLLQELAAAVTFVGPNGQGLLLKLAINISLAAQAIAFSEGLLLAERGGVDAKLAADTIAASPVGSPMLKARVPMFLDSDQQAWFDIRLMHKDIGLALQTAREQALQVPATEAADDVLDEASKRGYDERDIAAIHDVLAGAA